MRLVQVKVCNFRCFKDETTVDMDNLVVFIGRNDSGKSSLLDAMNIFLNDSVPEQDDLCVQASDQKVSITCVFDELPTQLVIDEQYPTNLADEYILNQNGRLEIGRSLPVLAQGRYGRRVCLSGRTIQLLRNTMIC